jgi:hypothetical protein
MVGFIATPHRQTQCFPFGFEIIFYFMFWTVLNANRRVPMGTGAG